MGTSSSSRGAWPLAVVLLLALFLHGHTAADAASTLADAAAAALREKEAADAEALREKEAAEAVPAAIVGRMVAAGYWDGYARWWLSKRCPPQDFNGTVAAMNCYAEALRVVKNPAWPWPWPPRGNSPEEIGLRRVLEISRPPQGWGRSPPMLFLKKNVSYPTSWNEIMALHDRRTPK
ncbi:hypothetical protein ACP4OV_019550 [Aristida adscensionis]